MIVTHPVVQKRIDTALVDLRRYARALTGSSAQGDILVEEVMKKLRDPLNLPNPRLAMFKTFHTLRPDHAERLARVGTRQQRNCMSREVLLLRSLEGFGQADVADILHVGTDVVAKLHAIALSDLRDMRPTQILLIEDEPLIAMDMSHNITNLGHAVAGIARTKAEAVDMASRRRPDLIISDIHLADASSGIDAVAEIQDQISMIPVIFVTGFPELLLTGQKEEPAIVIKKPYTDDQILSAISLALYASPDT